MLLFRNICRNTFWNISHIYVHIYVIIYGNVLFGHTRNIHVLRNVLLFHVKTYMSVKYMGRICYHIFATYIFAYLKRPILALFQNICRHTFWNISRYFMYTYFLSCMKITYSDILGTYIHWGICLSNIWFIYVTIYLGQNGPESSPMTMNRRLMRLGKTDLWRQSLERVKHRGNPERAQ